MSRFFVSASIDRYRRAGRPWFRTPTPVEREAFTDEQWAQLEADPRITVFDTLAGDPPDDVAALKARIAELETENAELKAQLESSRADTRKSASLQSGASGATHPTRAERISGAIATALEADGPELRPKTGRPLLSRVREIAGLADVTGAERDAAWAEVQGTTLKDG